MARKQATIFDTISSGDPARVKRFLSRRPEAVAERDAAGVSPLMRALYDGNAAVVEAILARSPELDLFEAAALGETETLRGLLGRSKRRANAFSPDGFAPLHLAAYYGRTEAARLLVERGADVETAARNPRLATVRPLHSAAAGRATEVAALLLEHGADPNAVQAGGWTPLHAAAANGNAELVRLLLKRGADPKRSADDRTPPIEFAIENRHHEVVELLQRATRRGRRVAVARRR